MDEKPYIVITGGVSSGIGKGVLSGSIAYLLESKGYRVAPVKFDGVLNKTFGSMNPLESAMKVVWQDEEVFVLDDGSETDKDLGVYERFINRDLNETHNIVNGTCLETLVNATYPPGEVVKISPHLLDIYEDHVREATKDHDIGLIEVGGTVGDDENAFFLKMLQRLKNRHPGMITSIHQTYIPINPLGKAAISRQDELVLATGYLLKPAKNSIRDISSNGLTPDIVVCRNHVDLAPTDFKRLADASYTDPDRFFSNPDIEDVYELPALLEEQGLDTRLLNLLGMTQKEENTSHLRTYTAQKRAAEHEKAILIVGDTESWGSYVSLKEAVIHAGYAQQTHCQLTWASDGDDLAEQVARADGVLITAGDYPSARAAADIGLLTHTPVLAISEGTLGLVSALGIDCTYHQKTPFLGGLDAETRSQYMTKLYGTRLRERHRRNFGLRVDDFEGRVLVDAAGEDGAHIIRSREDSFAAGCVFNPEYTSRPGIPNPLIKEFVRQVNAQ